MVGGDRIPKFEQHASVVDRLNRGRFRTKPLEEGRETDVGGVVLPRARVIGAGRDVEGQQRVDAAAGRRFRECVLEPGAAAGGAAMMEAFLGRPFREDAYFERLGVPVSS